jgi:hypothetical protein
MNEPQAVPEANTVPQGASVDTNPVPQGMSVDADAVPQGAGADTQNANPAPDYRAMYENLRRENEILRHNAEITQHAPVQGVSGGGAVAAPVDDFVRGFDSDTWGE